MNGDWFWALVFVLLIAGLYIAEAFDMHRRRMEKIEERLDRIESKHSPS
jgi:hypothetical protein